jgi:hypothetical protein
MRVFAWSSLGVVCPARKDRKEALGCGISLFAAALSASARELGIAGAEMTLK